MGEPAERVVVVTGGTSGIGFAVASLFAARGDTVVVTGTNSVSGATATRALDEIGQVEFVRADVSDPREVQALADRIARRFGQWDVAVNNAGTSGPARPVRLHEYDYRDWQTVIGVNLTGVWLCMKAAITAMLAQESGAVINIGSYASQRGLTGRAAYVASKHGVVGLTRAGALEYGGCGIRVNAVCPGPTRTPLVDQIITDNPGLGQSITGPIPQNRLAEPDEIARAVFYLAGGSASFVNGAILTVDGGMSA